MERRQDVGLVLTPLELVLFTAHPAAAVVAVVVVDLVAVVS